mgnify:CR=1 FL=1
MKQLLLFCLSLLVFASCSTAHNEQTQHDPGKFKDTMATGGRDFGAFTKKQFVDANEDYHSLSNRISSEYTQYVKEMGETRESYVERDYGIKSSSKEFGEHCADAWDWITN